MRVHEPKTLLTGLAFGESPRWHDNRLWFANWGMGEIVAVTLDGKSEVMVSVPTAIPFCFDWLPSGHLLVVSGREVQLLRREPGGSLVTHTDLTGLSRHPWNEIVVDGRGNAYVNNIGFAFGTGEAFAPGIVALVTPDGAARQVADNLAFPNGMVVTPDNATLIVAESYGARLTAFNIAMDGSLSNRRAWADLLGAAPDGICLDTDAVWYSDVPNRQCVRVREGGEVLERIELDRGCFACMFGGIEKRTLFLMAAEFTNAASMGGGPRTGQVLTVDVPAPGVGWPKVS